MPNNPHIKLINIPPPQSLEEAREVHAKLAEEEKIITKPEEEEKIITKPEEEE